MLLQRFSHLTVFSNLLTLAFTHPLEDQNEQHTDITIREPRGLSQPSLDHSHLNLQIPTLSRRNNIIGGYQISLFRHVQILPITVAAEDLRQFWTGVMIAVDAKRQTNDHVLPVRFGNLEIHLRVKTKMYLSIGRRLSLLRATWRTTCALEEGGRDSSGG